MEQLRSKKLHTGSRPNFPSDSRARRRHCHTPVWFRKNIVDRLVQAVGVRLIPGCRRFWNHKDVSRPPRQWASQARPSALIASSVTPNVSFRTTCGINGCLVEVHSLMRIPSSAEYYQSGNCIMRRRPWHSGAKPQVFGSDSQCSVCRPSTKKTCSMTLIGMLRQAQKQTRFRGRFGLGGVPPLLTPLPQSPSSC
jgi:hypothetical protein